VGDLPPLTPEGTDLGSAAGRVVVKQLVKGVVPATAMPVSATEAAAAAGSAAVTAAAEVTTSGISVEEVIHICGNGARTTVEECDDGGRIVGDGCSANCTVEAGFVCSDRIGQTSTCAVPVDPTLYFDSTSFGPFREGSNGTATVSRMGNNDTAVSVKYLVASSTAYVTLAENDVCASAGDFNDTSGVLYFAEGVTEATIQVPLLRDNVWEQTLSETERIALVLYDAVDADIDETRYISYIYIRDVDHVNKTIGWCLTEEPTILPSPMPTTPGPTAVPTTPVPSPVPTSLPTVPPTPAPSSAPSPLPTTPEPTSLPTTPAPSMSPTTSVPTTPMPTWVGWTRPPTESPSPAPSPLPTTPPSPLPTPHPTSVPTSQPTSQPTSSPTLSTVPTGMPTPTPSSAPTPSPTSSVPTFAPTAVPTFYPTPDCTTDEFLYKVLLFDSSGVGGATFTISTNGTVRVSGAMAGTSTNGTYSDFSYVCLEDGEHHFVMEDSTGFVSFEFDDHSGHSFRGESPIDDLFHTYNGEVFGAPTAQPTVVPLPVPTALPSAGPSAVPTLVPLPAPTALPVPGPSASPTPSPTPSPSSAPTGGPTRPPTPLPTLVPSVACETNTSRYKLVMRDEGGDGWGGATWEVTTDGELRATGTLDDGYRGATYICLEDGSHTFVIETDDDDIYFEFDDTSGNSFSGRAPITDIFQTADGEIFGAPSLSPTISPFPTSAPTPVPSLAPSYVPSSLPTPGPTARPTYEPTALPTALPSSEPTSSPTSTPTFNPTYAPTFAPSPTPTDAPTPAPTSGPTFAPSSTPTYAPTYAPSSMPTLGCTADDEYLYKLVLQDSAGDGWGGVGYNITTGGALRLSGTLNGGSRAVDQLCLEDGQHEIQVGGSASDGEISWTFLDTHGDSFSGAAGVTDVFHTAQGEVYGAPSAAPTVSAYPTSTPTEVPTTSGPTEAPTRAATSAPTGTFAPSSAPSSSPSWEPTAQPTFAPYNLVEASSSIVMTGFSSAKDFTEDHEAAFVDALVESSSYISSADEVTSVNASMVADGDDDSGRRRRRRLLDSGSSLSVDFTVALVSVGNHTTLVSDLVTELISATNSTGNSSFAATFVSAAEDYDITGLANISTDATATASALATMIDTVVITEVEYTRPPSLSPTPSPTIEPSAEPSAQPSAEPSARPSAEPTGVPTSAPTSEATPTSTSIPSVEPEANDDAADSAAFLHIDFSNLMWHHYLLAFAIAALVTVLLKLSKHFLFPKQLKVVPVDDMDRPPAPQPAAANRNALKASATIAPTIEETHADAQHMFNTPLPNITPSDSAPAEEPKGEPESKADEPDGAGMEEPPAIARADSEAEMDVDGDGPMHIGMADAQHLFDTPLPGQGETMKKKKSMRRKRSSSPGKPMDMPASFAPLPSVASVLEIKKQKSMAKLKAMKSFGAGKGAFGGIAAGNSAKIGIATDEGAGSNTSALLLEKGGMTEARGGKYLPHLSPVSKLPVENVSSPQPQPQPVRIEVGQNEQPEPASGTDSAPGAAEAPDGATVKQAAAVVTTSGMAAEEQQAEALRSAAEDDARKATEEAARRRDEKLKAYRDATNAAANDGKAVDSVSDDAAENAARAAFAATVALFEEEEGGDAGSDADDVVPMNRAAAPPVLGAATWNVESMSDLLGPSNITLDPLTLDAPTRPAPGNLAQAADDAAPKPKPFARGASALNFEAAGTGGSGGGGSGGGGGEALLSTELAHVGERVVASSLFEIGGAAANHPKGKEEGGDGGKSEKKKFQAPGGFDVMRAETFKDLDFDN